MKRIWMVSLIVAAILSMTALAIASANRQQEQIPTNDEEVSSSAGNTDFMDDDLTHSLPVVGSYENLKTLLTEAQINRNRLYGRAMRLDDNVSMVTTNEALEESSNRQMKSMANEAPASANSAADYSTTNIQTQGVDEGDVVKTDGKYIYQVNQQHIIIAEAYPADYMKVVSSIDYGVESFTPQEMYVDDQYLIVIGSTYYNKGFDQGIELPQSEMSTSSQKMIYPYTPNQSVKVKIYDISDKKNVKKVRVAELEGHYVSSRKIGSSLYLIANKNIDYVRIMNTNNEEPSLYPAPMYRDTASEYNLTEMDYSDIHYFPGPIEPNYLMIAGLNLQQPDQEMIISSYLGSGQNVYASLDNLYVAVTGYEDHAIDEIAESIEELGVDEETIDDAPMPPQNKVIQPAPQFRMKTTIYKFTLHSGLAKYSSQGEVPGSILNQYAMDEHAGYFRIATTKGDIWRDDEYTSKNNVYILDNKLKITGSVEDIAPGEQIYSVRFMGNRGYMVTYRTVDPLFVIDLENPKHPQILGQLKIPGYSDYLHPYDENHLIGFGKEAVEVTQKNSQGKIVGTTAFYQGMKLAIFDVSDVAHPKEKFTETIGGRGTDSELLHNPKALLFAKEKNLLSFPVTVMEVKSTSKSQSDVTQFGEFTFQGAYVYHLDLVEGFKLHGKITHLSASDIHKAGQRWYGSDKNVERILYINDTLYSLSKGMLAAHDIASLKEKNHLTLRP